VLELRANGGQDTPVLGGAADVLSRRRNIGADWGLRDGNRLLQTSLPNNADQNRTEWACDATVLARFGPVVKKEPQANHVDFSLIYTFII
jgi:hypothetical protein